MALEQHAPSSDISEGGSSDDERDPVQRLILQKAAARHTGGEAQEPSTSKPNTAPGQNTDASDGPSSSDRRRQRLVKSSADDVDSAEEGEARPSPIPAPPLYLAAGGVLASTVTPVGVVVVEDGQEVADAAARRRTPRYFDDGGSDRVVRCFTCGGVGHVARHCTHPEKDRPCFLCAQFGHEGRDCPNRLCFRCGLPGHLSRDCPRAKGRTGAWDEVSSVCLRCGDASCAAAQKGDYFRYEGGCTGEYSAADLAQALCYHCGQAGHLCCGTTPSEPPTLSCYNCGRSGHGGEQCPHDVRAHLHAERISDMKREREDLRQQEEAARDYSRGRAAPQYNSRDPPRRSATWGGHDYERASQQAGPRTEFSRHREAQEQGAGQDSWRGPGRRGPGDGRRPNSAGRINWDLESKPYRGGGGSSHYAGRPSSAQQHYGERGSSHRPAAPKFTPHAIPPAAFGTGGKNTDKGGGSGSAAGSPSAGKKRGGWQRDDDYPYDPSDMRADYSPSWRKAKTPRW